MGDTLPVKIDEWLVEQRLKTRITDVNEYHAFNLGVRVTHDEICNFLQSMAVGFYNLFGVERMYDLREKSMPQKSKNIS
jgi:hypothetical protein